MQRKVKGRSRPRTTKPLPFKKSLKLTTSVKTTLVIEKATIPVIYRWGPAKGNLTS